MVDRINIINRKGGVEVTLVAGDGYEYASVYIPFQNSIQIEEE